MVSEAQSVDTGHKALCPVSLVVLSNRIHDLDTVKTGHCHSKRAELGVKRGKGGLYPFSGELAHAAQTWLVFVQ